MPNNGYRVRSNAELSPYQKRIEAIENVILCVAEAERMVALVGKQPPVASEEAKPKPVAVPPIGCEFPGDEVIEEDRKRDV